MNTSQPTQGKATMTCQRCQGLMFPAELRDWESSPSQDCSDALRCLMCGEIVDPVIRSNRAKPRQDVKWRPVSRSRRVLEGAEIL